MFLPSTIQHPEIQERSKCCYWPDHRLGHYCFSRGLPPVSAIGKILEPYYSWLLHRFDKIHSWKPRRQCCPWCHHLRTSVAYGMGSSKALERQSRSIWCLYHWCLVSFCVNKAVNVSGSWSSHSVCFASVYRIVTLKHIKNNDLTCR